MSDITLSNSLTDLAARIRAEHEGAQAAVRRGIEHAMAAGDMLIEAKKLLKHGQWLPWLRDHCEMPDRTARHYMRLARGRKRIESEIGNVADFTVTGAVAFLSTNESNRTAAQFFAVLRIDDEVFDITELTRSSYDAAVKTGAALIKIKTACGDDEWTTYLNASHMPATAAHRLIFVAEQSAAGTEMNDELLCEVIEAVWEQLECMDARGVRAPCNCGAPFLPEE